MSSRNMDSEQNKISIGTAISELERCFDNFNQALYGGALPRPVITIQTAGRRAAYGWFWANTWKVGESEAALPEINLSAEYLSRPTNDICETLIHEMVHLDNWLNKITDCSSGQYHNKKFKEGCEKIGLVCNKGKYGWHVTTLGAELLTLVCRQDVNDEAFAAFRVLKSKEKVGSPLKKYSCGCTNVRVATDFDATCNLCGNEFEEQ